jgi:hypothetical protein
MDNYLLGPDILAVDETKYVHAGSEHAVVVINSVKSVNKK